MHLRATLALASVSLGFAHAAEPSGPWRSLPLVAGGKVAPGWSHLGYGSMAVDGATLRTVPDPKGLGLFLYRAETFGDCQIRVVYRTQNAKANAGVFVRVDPGVLDRIGDKGPAVERGPNGNLSPEMIARMKDASEKELGAWYAVHHGFELQICDIGDAFHRTGAVYSLAPAAPLPKATDEWRTMIITLEGDHITVDVDGKRVTMFDSAGKDIPAAKIWHEPKREPKRPRSGYIGLQTHDPGDIVTFREVSVRPLAPGR